MNKVVLITGSSRGIGKATAELFAKNGYNVVINYNNSKVTAQHLKNKLESSYNVTVDTIKCDLTCEDEIKKMLNFVIFQFNRIDVLINNAGIAIDTDLQDKTKDNFFKTLDVNLVGPFLLTRLVANFMKEQGFGSIVNISSTNGIDTYYPESIDYDASKAGLISLTHNLARYYAPIKVNCVCPGWVDTDMNKELSSEFKQKEINKIMLKRFANPNEVAEVIYFVANASYINNEVIRVDGGVLND